MSIWDRHRSADESHVDGRRSTRRPVPPLTPAGQDASSFRLKEGKAASWEDRHIWERCVTRGGMPNAMFPRFYNNNALIVQSPGYVTILLEEIHEARIIPLDTRPPLSKTFVSGMGIREVDGKATRLWWRREISITG